MQSSGSLADTSVAVREKTAILRAWGGRTSPVVLHIPQEVNGHAISLVDRLFVLRSYISASRSASSVAPVYLPGSRTNVCSAVGEVWGALLSNCLPRNAIDAASMTPLARAVSTHGGGGFDLA